MADGLSILCIGAHPDDCDIRVGGLAIKWARLGHRVCFVSLCNGDAGHFHVGGAPLAQRRYRETQLSAEVAARDAPGRVDYIVLDTHDCQLMATLGDRNTIIRLIRSRQADLVITNRPYDYMADHRYAAQLVQDAAYIVTLPNVEALTPHLTHNPVFAFWSDDFQRPYPFTAGVAVAIDDVIEQKLDMLHCHESQMYEWLPYNRNKLGEVPADSVERRRWLAGEWLPAMRAEADRCRPLLERLYGQARGRQVRHAEALEFCEYGRAVDDAVLARLFPFFS